MAFSHRFGCARLCGMDDNTLRLILAAALTPLAAGIWQTLLARYAAKTAGRRAAKRQQAIDRAHQFGRKLGRWYRNLTR